jgi:hypothetical protein
MGGAAHVVNSIKTRVESAAGVFNQRLKLNCDEPLSNVAVKFSLRCYFWAQSTMGMVDIGEAGMIVVGR